MEYFIADTHFFDKKCLVYDGRPFSNVDDMNRLLIENWNRVVKDGDTVYVVGDFSYGNGADIVSTAQRLKGKKILIRGNHDNDVNLKYAFAEIHEYLETRVGEGSVILCHYPIASFKDMQKGGTIHVYGHVHNSYEAKLANDIYERMRRLPNRNYNFEAYNVGCMQEYMDYTPRTITELRERTRRFALKFDR